MRIDSTPFDATLRQYDDPASASAGDEPAEFGPRPGSALAPQVIDDGKGPGTVESGTGPAAVAQPVTQARPPAEEAGVRSQPAAEVGQAPGESAPEAAVPLATGATQAVAATGTVPAGSKPIWSMRRKTGEEAQPLSSATKPNRQRTMAIAAGLFLVGIVLGPWLAQRTIAQAPVTPAPGQSVQAIADTLKASALGLPVPTVPAAGTTISETITATSVGHAQAPLTGDDRYFSMLQAIKASANEGQAPIHLVPKAAGSAPADGLSGRVAVAAGGAAGAYPAVPITLDIMQGRPGHEKAVDTYAPSLASTTGAIPTGRYLVIRIVASSEGEMAALMMPLGGDPARDAHWVYAGDSTVDGFAVEGVSARQVVLRSPAGRLVQLVPQS